jgi:hypothetical protein
VMKGNGMYKSGYANLPKNSFEEWQLALRYECINRLWKNKTSIRSIALRLDMSIFGVSAALIQMGYIVKAASNYDTMSFKQAVSMGADGHLVTEVVAGSSQYERWSFNGSKVTNGYYQERGSR